MPNFNIQHLLGEECLDDTQSKALNPIALFSLRIWLSLIKKFNLKNDQKLLKWAALDKNFKPAMYDPVFKEWSKKGLTAFCVATKNNKMKSFQELKLVFDLRNQDLFRYLQLRDYFNKEVMKHTTKEGVNPLIEVMYGAYQNKTGKIVSKLYAALLKNVKNNSLYVKTKWESELKVEITEEGWYHSLTILQTSTNSQQWREFNWKCAIRFFITPNIKSKQLGIVQPCWRDCDTQSANHSHIFWTCPKIQLFWIMINNTLQGVLGYNIPREFHIMFLGNMSDHVQKEDLYLTKILLTAARKAITKSWCKPATPDTERWEKIIQTIYIMEKLTHILRLREPSFHRKWNKWTQFLTLDSAQST